jgi:hemerythrin superfamily protein
MAHAAPAATAPAAASRRTGSRAAKPAARKRTPDLIVQLKADHREVSALHKAYEELLQKKAGAKARGELAARICQALTVHATAEEEVLYRALRSAIDADDLLDEADIEHASAKDLIAQIEALHPDDDRYDARVIVLCEYVKHHVKEEEGEMFPKARQCGELDLKAMGEAFAQRKAELEAELAE